MLTDTLSLPYQAIVPLGIALIYITLFLYSLLRQKLHNTAAILFAAYILLSIFWNINLVLAVTNVPTIPGVTWAHLASYGLIMLGLVYWAFARAFLQQPWTTPWGWIFGIIGLGLVIVLDMGWLILPPQAFSWSNGWLTTGNITFILSAIWWGLFILLVFVTTGLAYTRTENPAHKNRIQYIIIVTSLLAAGYGMYLSLLEPYWTIGLIVACLGSILATYIISVEDLIDLGTGARYVVRSLILALVTITVYVAGIYLVNIFIGDFLDIALPNRFIDSTLLVAAITAVLLTIVYTPIQRVSLEFANRLLFGQRYDYQTVIHNYTQTISNILYLNELSTALLTQLDQAPGVNRSALFIVDSETDDRFSFRSIPPKGSNDLPRGLSLVKNTPITNRLVVEQRQLPQYTIDISPQFKDAPPNEVETLKALNFERFAPILKNEKLVGMLTIGSKKSGGVYNSRDIDLLGTLADQTALALENAALFDRLQRNLSQTTRIKNLMDNVFDSIDNGVVTLDCSGNITFLNQAAESILNLSIESCVGKPYAAALPDLANSPLPTLVENVIQRESRYTDYEIISNLPERDQVNLSLNLAPLVDAQNQTQGVAIVMDDLTETKRLRAVQDMFRCYVSPAVVDRLPSDPSELRLGGHRQIVTVLFADIRGFTAFSEKLPSEKLIDVLNQYLSMAATSILMYEGTLDKFMGDAVMGIFNAPLSQEDHTLRAVHAAAAMQRAIRDYHQSLGKSYGLTFSVGLHVGEAVVGNVGTSDRMDYTAIGDTVNVAKRIQENSPSDKVLMSEDVYQATKDSINAVFYQELNVKGRERPVNTYELRSM